MQVSEAAPSSFTPKPPARILELDGVRGLAILMVLIYHYVEVPENGVFRYLLLPAHLGWSGVDLFFVLSGFLIGGILLDHRDAQRYYKVFYARRVHRIFPIYYLMVALQLLGSAVWPMSSIFASRMPQWAYLFYAQNLMGDFTTGSLWIGVTWSLAVEEQFYLIFPIVVRWLNRRRLLRVILGCVIGAPILRILLIRQGFGFEQVYPLLPRRADALALGVLAAMTVRSTAARSWVQRNSAVLYLCFGTLAMISITLLKWTTYRYVGTVGYSVLGIMYFLLIVLLLLNPLPLLKAVFQIRWLRWLGGISYCVYLIHQPVRAGALLLMENNALTGVVSACVTLAIATCSWRWFEGPLQRRGHLHFKY
jgi:peptidoglycan/LPS O-acetylase OafA/YrhL